MINLISNAKINTYLKVIGEEKGLHRLDTNIIKIELSNKIQLVENFLNKDCIYINNEKKFNTNIQKTLIELRKIIKIPYYDVKIESNIPVSAGLGSSSVDSAEIIKYFSKEYKLDEKIIKSLSVKIGSDVYALTKDYPTRIIGIGDKIEELKSVDIKSIILVYNEIKILTEDVFKKYDEIKDALFNSSNDLQLSALLLSNEFANDCAYLNEILKGAKMTGSGSAMFYEETNENLIPDEIIQKLKKQFKFVERINIINY